MTKPLTAAAALCALLAAAGCAPQGAAAQGAPHYCPDTSGGGMFGAAAATLNAAGGCIQPPSPPISAFELEQQRLFNSMNTRPAPIPAQSCVVGYGGLISCQ